MRTAIITGAGSGIGRAAALKLSGAGYVLALVGRTHETLHKVAVEIRQQNGAEALVVPADVSKPAEVSAMVERVHQQFGRIDVLINNAGLAPSVPTHQATVTQWHEILDTNLSSAFYAIRSVWPIMAGQTPRGGTIINISSMAAKDPFPGLGAYGVAKAGLNLLTLATAREGEAVNIRVIGIGPAAVDTPMFRKLVGEQNVNAQEILQPGDVADAIIEVVNGHLGYCSGDTIYLHRRPA